jgi:hypothetical protein
MTLPLDELTQNPVILFAAIGFVIAASSWGMSIIGSGHLSSPRFSGE